MNVQGHPDRDACSGIDPELIDEHFSRTPGLFKQVCAAFLDDAPLNVAAIRDLAKKGDHRALALAAHSLKGSSTLFGAQRLHRAASAVQIAAEQGNLESLDGLIADLDRELASVMDSLARLRKKHPAM